MNIRPLVCLAALGALLLAGCSEQAAGAGTAAATECAQSDLIAQCPPNTVAKLDADASAICEAEGAIEVEVDSTGGGAGEGEVTNACAGEGSCRVVCELMVPCAHGVESISVTEGIICGQPPAACGNGTCEAGETPDSCAIDCAAECVAGTSRCSGDQVQDCNLQGKWEDPRGCGSGTACISAADGDGCG